MIEPEMLQDLAATYGGIIPSVVDLEDTDKDRIAYHILCNDDTEVLEYLSESGDLQRIYKHSPDEAVRELKNAVWAAVEDHASQQIDEYNADRLQEERS